MSLPLNRWRRTVTDFFPTAGSGLSPFFPQLPLAGVPKTPKPMKRLAKFFELDPPDRRLLLGTWFLAGAFRIALWALPLRTSDLCRRPISHSL